MSIADKKWKPGDVAIVNGVRAIRTDNNMSWWTTSGRLSDPNVAHVRPLVVIDPEDREQVERLTRIYYGDKGGGPTPHDDRMQAALRAFANPTPPIEEPTGLGAVVEAICGCIDEPRRFIHDPLSTRFEGRPLDPNRTWKAPCGHHLWEVLTHVEVLSEGVPAEAKS